jgi:hypothetical protein
MGAACELLAVENRSNPSLEAKYLVQDERVRAMAEERQAQDAVQVRDAEYTSIGYSSGSGSAAVSTPAPPFQASSITYDPTAAALLSTTVQGALDELAALPTMAALRAIAPVTNKVAFTKSYATLGDGGGGSWYGAAGSPGDYTHNGGTVIVPSGGNGSAAWLRESPLPAMPEWFGAKGDGSTLDTTAFAALAAANPRAVEFGAKDYALGAQVTFQGPVTIRGAGMASTRLIWDGALASCGLSVLTGDGHDDKAEVTDMDLVRTGARGDGTALLIDGSATIDTGTIQPRTSARSYVNNVRVRGSSQLTDSWDVGLEMLSVLGGDIGTFDFVGSYTTAAPAWDGTAAVYIHGPGSAVEYNIDLIRAYSVATGLQVGGDGDQIEGVIIDKVLMVNVGKGVVWEDGGPQLRIASGHIAAWSGAVHADDCSQLSLGGLLCYALDGHDASYRHIYLKDCFLPNVAGCTFVDLEGTPDATNIYLENADGAMIGPNNHQNGAIGVLVDSGCGGVNIDAQTYADTSTTRVSDAGSGTIIADRRIRFFSSGSGSLGDSRITASGGNGTVGEGDMTIEANVAAFSRQIQYANSTSSVVWRSTSARQGNASLANASTFSATVSLSTNSRMLTTRWALTLVISGVAYYLEYLTKFQRSSGGTVTLSGALVPVVPVGNYGSPPAVTVTADVSGTTGRLNVLNSSGGSIEVQVDPTNETTTVSV